ncbi:hypothetical protein QWY14_15865 [Planococcus sp. N028]|uniref:Uncharacterized protein n=1 Tax=Planococcus shixiaomingii TaxID=3058393 RepID=A0ABT8N5W5_9BACL|nr:MULTISPECIES: hypothetical protein [unclassified Planococcus (in: firmicutes)]MDN7243281.1 hypothetical protein [Planococcus sp. N028]WKA55223.1 hypothetical protein QWY21_02235 [Planococcus sp. N022]
MTKRKLINGIILAFSVIFVRFIDVRVYDMHPVLMILLIIGLIAGLMKLASRSGSLEETVSRRTSLLINSAVILMLALSYFVLER